MVLGYGDAKPYSLQSALIYYYDELLKVTDKPTRRTFTTNYYNNGLYMDLGEAGKVITLLHFVAFSGVAACL